MKQIGSTKRIRNFDKEIEYHNKHGKDECTSRPMTPEEIEKYGAPIGKITKRQRDIKFLRREKKA